LHLLSLGYKWTDFLPRLCTCVASKIVATKFRVANGARCSLIRVAELGEVGVAGITDLVWFDRITD
jgi:hypothetical protein